MTAKTDYAPPDFEIVYWSDGCFEVFCDGTCVGAYSHDDLDWHGLEMVKELVRELARLTGGSLSERKSHD